MKKTFLTNLMQTVCYVIFRKLTSTTFNAIDYIIVDSCVLVSGSYFEDRLALEEKGQEWLTPSSVSACRSVLCQP